jgi:hypothetical protein
VADVTRAVEQIARIHAHLAAREVYHGWRALPVALSGAFGVGAAAVLSTQPPPTDAWLFLRTWLGVGVIALAIGCSEILWRHARSSTALERRRSRAVMRQFLPGLIAGAVLSATIVRVNPAFVVVLPGLWAICFSLATFAASPCLPPASAWAAGYYFVAGVVLLITAPSSMPSPWTVGFTFGVGQTFGALLIHVRGDRTTSFADDLDEAEDSGGR